jgi:hypothetical protein
VTFSDIVKVAGEINLKVKCINEEPGKVRVDVPGNANEVKVEYLIYILDVCRPAGIIIRVERDLGWEDEMSSKPFLQYGFMEFMMEIE